jgi:hypothetical protein
MKKSMVEKTVDFYVDLDQAFTVYQIWCDTKVREGMDVDYDYVRGDVENLINDHQSSISGWTRTVGNHLLDGNLDRKVGKVGEAPQIYHPVGYDITKYDPSFRLYNQHTTPAQSPTHNVVFSFDKNSSLNKRKDLGPVVFIKPPVYDNYPSVQQQLANKNRGKAGLFQFKVWHDGKLVDCNLLHERNPKGHFVKANPGEAVGYLADGSKVKVQQDADAKLYAVKV